jgi:hypothetical protein
MDVLPTKSGHLSANLLVGVRRRVGMEVPFQEFAFQEVLAYDQTVNDSLGIHNASFRIHLEFPSSKPATKPPNHWFCYNRPPIMRAFCAGCQ